MTHVLYEIHVNDPVILDQIRLDKDCRFQYKKEINHRGDDFYCYWHTIMHGMASGNLRFDNGKIVPRALIIEDSAQAMHHLKIISGNVDVLFLEYCGTY